MTTRTKLPKPPADISVGECAAFVGVSRTRVYQRMDGDPPGRSGRSLPYVVRTTGRPGTRRGRQRRIPLRDAIEWRDEREKAGLEIGPLPSWWPA